MIVAYTLKTYFLPLGYLPIYARELCNLVYIFYNTKWLHHKTYIYYIHKKGLKEEGERGEGRGREGGREGGKEAVKLGKREEGRREGGREAVKLGGRGEGSQEEERGT